MPDEGIETLFGSHDENLRQLEREFDVRIRTDGHALLVSGDAVGLARTEQVVDQLAGLVARGTPCPARTCGRRRGWWRRMPAWTCATT